jgi:hypothetical protein
MPTLTQTISFNLSSMSDSDLLKYGLTLLDGLPLVPAYADVAPTLAAARPVITSYGTAVANFAKGGEAARLQRDSLRPQVEAIIREWSQYATDETPEQPVLWATAHFNLTKAERTPRPVLGAPTKFMVADGPAKGSVELRQSAQAGTKAYVYEYAPVPAPGEEPRWQYCLGNTSTCVVSGLLSGQQYQFRAGAWNGMGALAYSQLETRYVQ